MAKNKAGRGVAVAVSTHAPHKMKHLHTVEVAARWLVSNRTLEGWRSKKRGPPFLKLGGRIAYRLADVEAFEAQNVHLCGGAK